MSTKKTQTIALHSVACILLLLMPIVDAPSPNAKKILLLNNPYFEIDFVLHLVCIVFGYFNYFVLIPRFFHKPLKLVYTVLVLVIFVFICAIPWLISGIPFFDVFQGQDNINIHFVIQIRHVFFLFITIFLFSLMTWSEQRRRMTERAISTADLRYLKAQINPHFLFNSLNSIYVQLQTNPSAAGNSLVKMSNIMRYIMKSAESQSENLNLAIDYLEDYLSLQEGRFQNTIQVIYKKNIPENTYQIAPLLLIPFVENAFKYGINPSEKAIISIEIFIKEGELFFEVVNQDYSKDIVVPASTGIGIANTRRRLDLIYPGRYSLSIDRGGLMFKVLLRIQF
ncbi:MAG: histidine kinase [Bacteroidota bacterium]